jgi:hypothetical protein
MARRRSSKLNVDMFPFLSVLCSVIGVLMLFLMIVISTRVIEAEEQNVPVDASAADEEGVEDGIKSEDYQRLEKEIAAKETELDRRIRDRDELVRKLRELHDLVRGKKQKMAQAVEPKQPPRTLGAKKKVEPIPDARFPVPGGRTPLFVEVSSRGYLVQPDNKQFAPVTKTGTGRSTRYNAAADLAAFLRERSRDSQQRYLLLLIHPSGTQAYRDLRAYLDRTNNSLKVGVEPFSSDWEFIRKKKP